MSRVVIHGRPDFGNPEFVYTAAKKHPAYVYSKNGMLIHKIAAVKLRWWDAAHDKLIRRDSPAVHVRTICQMTFFIAKRRTMMCAVPNPEAIRCGRCHGELATFRRGRKGGPTKQEAKDKLGCVWEAQ